MLLSFHSLVDTVCLHEGVAKGVGLTKPVSPTVMPTLEDVSVRHLLGVGLLTRLILDTGIQIFFPFLPVLAAGVGTNVVVLGRLVSLRSSMGLTAPLFGTLADKRGFRVIMRVGLLLAAMGYLGIALSQSIGLMAVSMVLAGIGTFSFSPTLQAYVSARLSDQRRARGLGLLESAWALSGVVGLAAIGFIIEWAGWRVPFFIIGGGLLLAFIYYGRLPSVHHGGEVETAVAPVSSPFSSERIRAYFVLGARSSSAWAVVLVSGLVMFAGMNLFINYGSWLSGEYALGAARLGTVALFLGLADLSGSLSVSGIGDWLGRRRTVLVGTVLFLLACVLLPWLNQNVWLAVVSLLLVRVSFEFSIVSNFPLLSDQLPQQRGKIMTLGAAVALLGSTAAGLTGPVVYLHFGVAGLAVTSGTAVTMAILLLWRLVRE